MISFNLIINQKVFPALLTIRNLHENNFEQLWQIVSQIKCGVNCFCNCENTEQWNKRQSYVDYVRLCFKTVLEALKVIREKG